MQEYKFIRTINLSFRSFYGDFILVMTLLENSFMLPTNKLENFIVHFYSLLL